MRELTTAFVDDGPDRIDTYLFVHGDHISIKNISFHPQDTRIMKTTQFHQCFPGDLCGRKKPHFQPQDLWSQSKNKIDARN